MAKTTLKVDGMMCEMCSNSVSTTLRKVKGVSDVKIDLKKGTADITHEGAKDEDLIRAVLDAGFRSKVKRGLF
jgi:copper chaperone CopZ